MQNKKGLHKTKYTIPYHTGPCKTIQDNGGGGLYIIAQLPTKPSKTIKDCTRPYRSEKGHSGHCRAIQDHTPPYRITEVYTRAQKTSQSKTKLHVSPFSTKKKFQTKEMLVLKKILDLGKKIWIRKKNLKKNVKAKINLGSGKLF